MKENRFFEKILENISKLNESQIRSFLEFVENERRTFKLILDSLDEGIMVVSEDRIIFLNDEARRILLGQNLKVPLPIQDAQKYTGCIEVIDFISRSLAGDDFRTELSLSGKDSRFVAVTKITAEDSFYIIKIKDISENKKMELRLKNFESISALNTMAAGIAHEIKNPLTAIDLHTQVIKKGLDKKIIDVPDEVKDYIRIIDDEQKRLNNIINDYLVAARKRELKLSFEDVNEYLRGILALLTPELEANSILLETSFGTVPRIFIDRDYLKQAFLNLVKNAMEAMKDISPENRQGRVLGIRTFYDNGVDSVGVAVSDTGPGIPEEKVTRIFEPYYTTKETGTGLGLTIVYKIVREHGGDIKVESQAGKGSVFTVFLPVNQGTKLIKQNF